MTGLTFHITVMPRLISIGCQARTYEEWMAVSRERAVEIGLPENEFEIVRAVIGLFHSTISKS